MKYLKLFEAENLYEKEMTKFFENLCDEKEIPFFDCVEFAYDENNEGRISVIFMEESEVETDMEFYTQTIKMELNSDAVYDLLKEEVTQTLLSDFDYYFDNVELFHTCGWHSDGNTLGNRLYEYRVKLKQNIQRSAKSGLLGLK